MFKSHKAKSNVLCSIMRVGCKYNDAKWHMSLYLPWLVSVFGRNETETGWSLWGFTTYKGNTPSKIISRE